MTFNGRVCGTPIGMPWTLIVESEGWSADLEHAAPLPRTGERIEQFRVTKILAFRGIERTPSKPRHS